MSPSGNPSSPISQIASTSQSSASVTPPFHISIQKATSPDNSQILSNNAHFHSNDVLKVQYLVPNDTTQVTIQLTGYERISTSHTTHKPLYHRDNVFYQRHLKVDRGGLRSENSPSDLDSREEPEESLDTSSFSNSPLTGSITIRLPSHLQPSVNDAHRLVKYELKTKVLLSDACTLKNKRELIVTGSMVREALKRQLRSSLSSQQANALQFGHNAAPSSLGGSSKKTQSKSFDAGTVTCSVTLDRTLVEAGSSLLVHCNVFNGSTAQISHLSAALYSRYQGEDEMLYPPQGISKNSFGIVTANSELHSSRQLDIPLDLLESMPAPIGRMALMIRREYFINLHVETDEGTVLMDIELPVYVMGANTNNAANGTTEDGDVHPVTLDSDETVIESLYAEGLLEYVGDQIDEYIESKPEKALELHEQKVPTPDASPRKSAPAHDEQQPIADEEEPVEDAHEQPQRNVAVRQPSPDPEVDIIEPPAIHQESPHSSPVHSSQLSRATPPSPAHSSPSARNTTSPSHQPLAKSLSAELATERLSVQSPRPRHSKQHHSFSGDVSRNLSDVSNHGPSIDVSRVDEMTRRQSTGTHSTIQSSIVPPQLNRSQTSPSTPSSASTVPRIGAAAKRLSPNTDPVSQYRNEHDIEAAVRQTRERLQEYQNLFDSFGKSSNISFPSDLVTSGPTNPSSAPNNSGALTPHTPASGASQQDYIPHPSNGNIPQHSPVKQARAVHQPPSFSNNLSSRDQKLQNTEESPKHANKRLGSPQNPVQQRNMLSPYADVNTYASTEYSIHSPRFSPRYHQADDDTSIQSSPVRAPQLEDKRLLNSVSQQNDDASLTEQRNGASPSTAASPTQTSPQPQAERPLKQGSIVYPDGSKYVGSITVDTSQRFGKGTLYYPDGSVYSGDFRDGLRSGWGVFSTSTYTYDGEFRNDVKEGFGVIIYANGEQYEGQWLGGYPDGEGCYLFADGSKYQGEFRRGLREGHGVLHYSDGITCYDGDWKGDKKSGKAEVRFPNGKYVGEMWNDMKHGVGRYFYQNGSQYEGQWAENVKHGKGTFKTEDGATHVGTWKNGVKHGMFFTQNGGINFKEKWKNGRLLSKRHAPMVPRSG